MNPCDSVLVPLPGTEPHPAIVLRIEGEWARVIYGTGTRRELPVVVVEERSREAKALELYKTTYFYRSNERLVKLTELRPRNRRCPPGLFLKLRDLVDSPDPT
jgi:hypothetical protein